MHTLERKDSLKMRWTRWPYAMTQRLRAFHPVSLVLLVLLSGLVNVVAGLTWRQSAQAATLTFTSLGAHPQAAAQSTETGRTLNKLKVFDGKLYAAYGDYTVNTGPIVINPYNLTSQSFEGSALSVPTESLGNWKVINGKLYTTTIDAVCSGTCPSGYAVYTPGGSWAMNTPVSAEHIFDISTLNGTDLWMFGSSGGSEATAWRSTDNGNTWNAVQTYENEPGGDNMERYYWGQALNGSMYMQSNLTGFQNPVQSFDGTTWDSQASADLCDAGVGAKGPNPVVFDGKILCVDDNNNALRVFDGQGITTLNGQTGYSQCNSANDMTTDGEYLYVLCEDWNGSANVSKVIRSPDLTNWQTFTGLPADARSITIDEATNKLYVGNNNAQLFAATLPAADATSPVVAITAPASSSTHSSFQMDVTATDNLEVTKVEFYLGAQLIATGTGEPPYTYTWFNQYMPNGTWGTPAGTYALTAKAYDFAGNVSTSSAVSVSITEPAVNLSQFSTGNPVFGSSAMTRDNAGNLWFYDAGDPLFGGSEPQRFGKLNVVTGQTTHYAAPAGAPTNILSGGMVIDASGALWYADCNQDKAMKFNPISQQLDEYPVADACREETSSFAVGGDGAVYSSTQQSTVIERITANGTQSTITLPANFKLKALNVTADGTVITNIVDEDGGPFESKLATVSAAGLNVYYSSNPSDPAGTGVYGRSIVRDADGTTWSTGAATQDNPPELIRISSQGVVTQITDIYPPYAISTNIQLAPNGDLWLTSYDGLLGRYTPSSGQSDAYKLLAPASEQDFGSEASRINQFLGLYSSMIPDLSGNIWVGDGFGNRFVKLTPLTSETDTDGDTIPDLVENAGPNNGDANGDTIQDRTQQNVVSLVSSVTGEYVVLAANSQCAVSRVGIAPESDNVVQDSGFNYVHGMMYFTMDCGSPGFVATINQYYYGVSGGYSLRKYHPTTRGYATIEEAVFTTPTLGGRSALKASYNLTEGGPLDTDGVVNDVIVDPAGLAQPSVGVPNTGFGGVKNAIR